MKNTIQIANQIHSPKKKYESVNEGENKKQKLWYKDGHSTMLFCKEITKPAASVFISSIKENAKKLGVSLQGHFLITQ